MHLGWLFERMEAVRDRDAVIWNGERASYGLLLDEVAGWRAEIANHAIPAGATVAIHGDYSPAVCALLLALVDAGCIVVPLTSAVEAQMPRLEAMVGIDFAIVFDKDRDWRIEVRPATAAHELISKLRASGDPGLVLFSSGSTGDNKAALHSFARLMDKFRTPRNRLVTLGFLLLDHIGGINTLLYTLSNGGTLVALSSRDPDAVCEAIDLYGVALLPTSPTFLNLLLISEAYQRHDLSSLKLMTYGTEPMPESTLLRLHQIFPDKKLQQTYGLSELGILRSKSRSDDSLWLKVGGEGFETRIVDGILWIKAESAMLGYLNYPTPFDSEGWFNTGDEVAVDGEWIRFLGRKSEIINVGGEKVFPAEVESALLEMENVADVTVRGEPNPIVGNVVVATFNLVQPESNTELRRRVRSFCAARMAPYKIPAKVEIAETGQYSTRFKRIRRRD